MLGVELDEHSTWRPSFQSLQTSTPFQVLLVVEVDAFCLKNKVFLVTSATVIHRRAQFLPVHFVFFCFSFLNVLLVLRVFFLLKINALEAYCVTDSGDTVTDSGNGVTDSGHKCDRFRRYCA